MLDIDGFPRGTVHPDIDSALAVGRCVGAARLVFNLQRRTPLRARPGFLGGAAREELRAWRDHLHVRKVRGPDRLEQRRPIAAAVPLRQRLADRLLGPGIVALAEVVPAQGAALTPEEERRPAVGLIELPEREL